MFGFDVKTEAHFERVSKAVADATPRALERMSIEVVQTARGLFIRSTDPSRAGSPPHSGTGKLPDSIDFAVGPDDSLIGTRFSHVGKVGAVHEFGGEFMGQRFDRREFMGPALEIAAGGDRLTQEWYGVV